MTGTEFRDLITWTLGTILALSAVVGLVVKWVLLPYLREHLVKPLGEVKHQVQNSHTVNLRDDLDARFADLIDRVEKVDGRVEGLAAEHRAMASMFDGHLGWSERLVKVTERDIDSLRNDVRRIEGGK